MNTTPQIIIAICIIVAMAALLGWPREDEPDVEIRPDGNAWAHYFIRLYRATFEAATFEAFDREGFKADRKWIHTSKERIDREAHSVAMTAMIDAWQDAHARYDAEWQRINRGYFTTIAKLRDQGVPIL